MKGFLIFLFGFIFPARCPACQKDLPFFPNKPGCQVCIQSFRLNSRQFLTRFLASLQCYYLYEEPIRSFVLRAKYHAKDYLFPFLLRSVVLNLGEFDYIVAVPGHPVKDFLRGYSSSSLIAQVISAEIGTPFLKNIVQRNIFSKTQKKLNKTQRWENARKSFSLAKSAQIICSEKKILLVDDVCTTSSTLEICAELLKKAGAKEVHAWALCYEELQK